FLNGDRDGRQAEAHHDRSHEPAPQRDEQRPAACRAASARGGLSPIRHTPLHSDGLPAVPYRTEGPEAESSAYQSLADVESDGACKRKGPADCSAGPSIVKPVW